MSMWDSVVASVAGVVPLVVVSVAGGTVADVSGLETAGAGSFVEPGDGCGSVLGDPGSVIVG